MSDPAPFGYSAACSDGRDVWVPVGQTIDAVCARPLVDPGDPGTGEPEITLQPAVTQGTGTTPPTGLDPAAPGGPGQRKAWGAELLAWIFGDDEPMNADPAKPPGCCPQGERPCLACWLRKNAGWLLLLALAVAAFVLRKKP
jgi:hypothetical protein